MRGETQADEPLMLTETSGSSTCLGPRFNENPQAPAIEAEALPIETPSAVSEYCFQCQYVNLEVTGH